MDLQSTGNNRISPLPCRRDEGVNKVGRFLVGSISVGLRWFRDSLCGVWREREGASRWWLASLVRGCSED